jgi:hypothetical protein
MYNIMNCYIRFTLWHNRAPASGEYTITPEDGRVRPKHVDD